jgi:hypothetical protein
MKLKTIFLLILIFSIDILEYVILTNNNSQQKWKMKEREEGQLLLQGDTKKTDPIHQEKVKKLSSSELKKLETTQN